MREKDDMLQIDFGAPRCSIWVQQMSGTGRHLSALVGIGRYWKMGITGGVGPRRDRGRPGGDWGETKGRPRGDRGSNTTNNFCLLHNL